MIKKEIKGFVAGTVVTAVLMASPFSMAQSFRQNIEAVFNSVNLKVNGKIVQADNILYAGTTYVPLRAIGEMLNKDIGWDQATKTASINDKVAVTIPEPNTNETVSQKNAVRSANSYLEFTAFSKSGLIKQLKFEGFSEADATYAVGQINVNWKEQAVLSAKSYLEFTAFSRDGLIKQLIFEGFTNDEATYAATQVGF